MTKIEELRALESRQVELLATMQKSDAHALKCTKLGLDFATTYPEDEAEYSAAREEFNSNEEAIAALKQEIADEEVANAENAPHEELPKEEE